MKVLDLIVNKFHMILGGVYAAAITVFHFKTGKDLGPGFVSATYAFYGFLLGHAGVYQKWPDQDGQNPQPDPPKQ